MSSRPKSAPATVKRRANSGTNDRIPLINRLTADSNRKVDLTRDEVRNKAIPAFTTDYLPEIGNIHDTTTLSAVQQAKYERKKIEIDLQLLASRISLLRNEEHKSLTKISETKARAKEILLIKKEKEIATQNKLSELINRELHVKDAQERAAIQRENRQQKLSLSKKLFNESKRTIAEEQKKQIRQMNVEYESIKRKIEIERRIKAERLRHQREIQRRNREQQRLVRDSLSKSKYAEKLKEEMKRKDDAVELIEMLENEECELIERLRKAHSLQKDAYSILGRSLAC